MGTPLGQRAKKEVSPCQADTLDTTPILLIPKSSKKARKRYDSNNNEISSPAEVICKRSNVPDPPKFETSVANPLNPLTKFRQKHPNTTIIIVNDSPKKPKKHKQSKPPDIDPPASPKVEKSPEKVQKAKKT